MSNNVSKPQVNRLNRIVVLGLSMFAILITTYIGAAWMLYQEITHTYVDHYNSLSGLGITNAITSPEVVGERVLMLISLFPLTGICFAAPLLYTAVREVIALSQEKRSAIQETMHLVDEIQEYEHDQYPEQVELPKVRVAGMK